MAAGVVLTFRRVYVHGIHRALRAATATRATSSPILRFPLAKLGGNLRVTRALSFRPDVTTRHLHLHGQWGDERAQHACLQSTTRGKDATFLTRPTTRQDRSYLFRRVDVPPRYRAGSSRVVAGSPFLTNVSLRDERRVPGTHPFDIPILRGELSLTTPVTFFVGENGSGKSTLLEALAWAVGFGSQGGSRDHKFEQDTDGHALGRALALGWRQRRADCRHSEPGARLRRADEESLLFLLRGRPFGRDTKDSSSAHCVGTRGSE